MYTVGHYNSNDFIDRIFDQFHYCDPNRNVSNSNGHNLTETNDTYQYTLDVPGFRKKDLQITYDTKTNYLKISGETESRKIDRTIKMKKINPDKITSTVENGILTLELPKSEEEKTRIVKIL